MSARPAPVRRVRKVRVVHRAPGRLRLRLDWLREDGEAASALADELARVDGMVRVTVRPLTGSVLCEYLPDELHPDAILAAACACSGVPERVDGEEPLREEVEGYARLAATDGAELARVVAKLFRQLNLDLLRVTRGRADLGVAVSLAFLSLGVAQVAKERRVPVPPWFNLAWWAFRTFNTLEKAAIAKAREAVPASPPPAEPYSGPDRRRGAPVVH